MDKLRFYLLFLTLLLPTIDSEFTQEREEVLDNAGKYWVHWSIDYENKIVLFNLTCETTGWIGFGISSNGGMTAADIVMGGVDSNGRFYFTDRHGTGQIEPVIDGLQNWAFHTASENGTHTFLQFSRIFDTCDVDDLPFTNDTTNFIWALGSSDEIFYHGPGNRGTFTTNLLDTELSLDTSQLLRFEVLINNTMPSVDTTYWCKIVQSPPFDRKHHFVAFDAVLNSNEAKKHTHHYTIYKCNAPLGQDPDEYFAPYVGQPGGECYGTDPIIPLGDCRPILFVWGIGEKLLNLPENVGYPVGEAGRHEYYMLELHYDNPELLEGVHFETGAVIYYTDELRPIDAGLMLVSYEASAAFLIPPKIEKFTAVGHCDSGCTSNYIPESGINVFATFFHSHLSGRTHRFRLFRNNQELPWIANDDNYDFEYQQTRLMRNPLTLLPGDQLAAECGYSTTWRNGTTLGGFTTKNEMCEHFVWYYPKIELTACVSVSPIELLFQKFGIEQVTGDYFNPTILKPEDWANMTFLEVLDTEIEWTPELKEEIQGLMSASIHENTCISEGGERLTFPTGYPPFQEEYVPINECS